MISIEMFNNFLNLTIWKNFQHNLIISKIEIKNIYLSTTDYGIFRYHRIVKQNRKQLEIITDYSSAPSTPLISYEKLNENTDITGNKPLTAEAHSSTTFAPNNKPSEIIQSEPVSTPYTKHMLISNISVDDYAQ